MNVEHQHRAAHDLSLDLLDDADLVLMVRGGDSDAYAALFDRYVYSGRRLARHLGQRDEADDVVSEAFARIFDLLQRGKGPDDAFRAYLFTTIRHECGRRAKAEKRVVPTDDDAKIDSAVPFGGGELDDFEKTAVRAAYESLPPRWRTVLWHLDVEGRKPSELAELLDMKPNSVSALVYRARGGLRDAYLQQHVGTGGDLAQACGETRRLMASVVRRTASTRDQERVHAHLDGCAACMGAYIDLEDVNREVGAVAPVLGLVAGSSSVATGSLLAAAKSFLVGAATVAAVAAGTVTVVSVTAPGDQPSAPVAVRVQAQEVPSAASVAPPASTGPTSTPRSQATAPDSADEPVASKAEPSTAAPDPVAPAAKVPTPAPEPERTRPDIAVDVPTVIDRKTAVLKDALAPVAPVVDPVVDGVKDTLDGVGGLLGGR